MEEIQWKFHVEVQCHRVDIVHPTKREDQPKPGDFHDRRSTMSLSFDLGF